MPSATLSNPNVQVRAAANYVQGGASLQIQALPTFQLAADSAAGTFPTANVDLALTKPFLVTSGTPFTFNVSSGSDQFGNTLAAAYVLYIMVENDSDVIANIFTVGGGTHPLMGSDQMTVKRGGSGVIFNPDGYTVTPSSADTITITAASGTNVPGVLTILARSA